MKQVLTEIKAEADFSRKEAAQLFIVLFIWVTILFGLSAWQAKRQSTVINQNIITNHKNQLLIIENQALIINRFDSLKVKSKYLH